MQYNMGVGKDAMIFESETQIGYNTRYPLYHSIGILFCADESVYPALR